MHGSPENKSLRRVTFGLILAIGAHSLYPVAKEDGSSSEGMVTAKTTAIEQPPQSLPAENENYTAVTYRSRWGRLFHRQPFRTTTKDNAKKDGGTDLGAFTSTCYALRGKTASGMSAGHGRVAVDTDVIPLGTQLYIEEYGEAVAADTGSAIQGRRIDIWKPTSSECRQWGRQVVEVSKL